VRGGGGSPVPLAQFKEEIDKRRELDKVDQVYAKTSVHASACDCAVDKVEQACAYLRV
jgi:hypothetical protein